MRWSGFAGAPGYSSFYFAGGGGLITDAQQVADRVSDAIPGLAAALPGDVRIAVENEVERLDSDTGEILGFHSVTTDAGFTGGGSGGYSAASGAVINWRTDDVRFGRRIRGRTFIVPLAGNGFDADGTLSASALSDVNGFANAIRGGDLDSELVVWSRPRDGAGGVAATVTGHSVPDMAAVLRSRRD